MPESFYECPNTPVSSVAEATAYVAKRLKLARSMRKVTLVKAAARLKISRKQMQNYESGQSNINIARLWEISRMLNVDPGFFLEGLNSGKNILSNENLEFIRSFDNIKDKSVKSALFSFIKEL